MARSISTIKNQIIAKKNADSNLGGWTSTSKTARWNLWAFIIATCINMFEQLQDIYFLAIEGKIKVAGVGTAPWLREQILKFQSGDVVVFDSENFTTNYAVVDETKRILTRCSISTIGTNNALVRVAKSEPPVKISDPELTELIGYSKSIQFAGTNLTIKTFDSDKLYLDAIVYYKGEYATTIQANVIAALDLYLANISSAGNFGGKVKINEIIDTIQGVDGVFDLKLNQVAVRADLTAFGSRTIIYDLATGINIVNYDTISGYVVQETTSGNTFTDKITFTVDA